MPVTFGTVQVVPPSIAPQAASGGGASAPATGGDAVPPAPRARELLPVVRQLHDRATRVRAH